ncbi:alpha/beta hydrolase [Salinirubellus salinus]|jgi:pimeloyl-ACP methyl ester carboxylesterase|uniref:Alpha/beta hydrolase n=1 Tax=Salinirubellus salinus TaxID=1364945 RepID=A0A9E7U4S7_9EURY|nr:alpha/beta hydrolase [Salinirubellus salinus]UWM54645.1 alpha/beta hydrolase [Salinirubellus salinus]UWM54718.1 alpha/beta hydrolase [Salinirubellus salinus]
MSERAPTTFESAGTECAAWHYPGDDAVVVMAHGFAGTRRMRLPAYAETFAERGLGVLLFDYRTFGDSDGEPRNHVDPFRHVVDWEAAVDHARSLGYDRLGVWGTSFSGGHALVTAAREDVDAYVGQTPFYDGVRTLLHITKQSGLGFALEATKAGLDDTVRGLLGREPRYVPAVAQPGELAAMNTPGSDEGYRSMVPDELDEAEWNKVTARFLLPLLLYRPVSSAADVECPAFVAAAREDQLVPGSAVEQTVERLADVERLWFDGDHFDVYTGEQFERVAGREADFLERHLL